MMCRVLHKCVFLRLSLGMGCLHGCSLQDFLNFSLTSVLSTFTSIIQWSHFCWCFFWKCCFHTQCFQSLHHHSSQLTWSVYNYVLFRRTSHKVGISGQEVCKRSEFETNKQTKKLQTTFEYQLPCWVVTYFTNNPTVVSGSNWTSELECGLFWVEQERHHYLCNLYLRSFVSSLSQKLCRNAP